MRQQVSFRLEETQRKVKSIEKKKETLELRAMFS